MRNRTGKIARLPRHIREELNGRLEGNHPGRQIVDWLNSLPEVQEVLENLFHGKPVSEQNLSEWRHGGYAEWLTRREFVEDVQEKAHNAADIEEAAALMADHAAGLLAIRYADALTKWNGDPDDPAFASLKHLSGLVRDVAILSRRAERATRLKMDQFAFDAACHSRGRIKPDEVRFAGSPYVRKWSRRFGPADSNSCTEKDAVAILEGMEAHMMEFLREGNTDEPPPSQAAASTVTSRKSNGIKPSQTTALDPENRISRHEPPLEPATAPFPEGASPPPALPTGAVPEENPTTASDPALSTPPVPLSDADLWQMRSRALPGDPEPAWRTPVRTIPPWEAHPWQTYEPFEPRPAPRRTILARADR